MDALIVDDHPLFAEGLKLLLLAAAAVTAVDCVADGAQALSRQASQPAELVLLDWNLGGEPAGAALIAALREVAPQSRVVVVSGSCTPALVATAVEAGAVGFVPKTASPRGMVDALRVAAAGGISLPAAGAWVGAAIPGDAAGEPASPARAAELSLNDIADVFPMLTPRQQQVLAALARGLSNKAIARLLDAAEGTIKQHAHAIYQALGVDNRTEALYLLARRGVRL